MNFATLLPAIIRPHTRSHYPGIGQATNCQIDLQHNPPPIRYVWHHICPQACGGKTEQSNLVSLCDTCHYGIHYLTRLAAENDGEIPAGYPADWVTIAQLGYEQAKKNGKLDKIPHEGHATK